MLAMRRNVSCRLAFVILFVAFFSSSCGTDSGNEIVGLMVSPASTTSSVGGATGFHAVIRYVDEHETAADNVNWSIHGSASMIVTSSGSEATVMCVRPSDYFAGGYVGDNVNASCEFKGQTYSGFAVLVCR